MLPGKTYKPEDILAIAWRRRWQIIVPFLLVAGGAIRYSQTLPDRYRSETVILIVPQRVPESYVHSTVTSRIEDRLRSINQQIMSRTRLEPIIQTLNLYPGLMKNGLVEDAVARMRLDADVQVVKGDAFRVSFIANDAADGDEGHAAARVAVHRREPQGSRGAGRGHQSVPRLTAGQRQAAAD